MNNWKKLKKRQFYVLHRDKEKDHELGRPAILLNNGPKNSLVWIGTTQIDKFNKEKPLMLKINLTKTYFYTNAITLVKTADLKSEWIFTKNNQPYVLEHAKHKLIIQKFTSFSDLENPYDEINYLKKVIETEKKKNIELNNMNIKLKENNQILRKETENLINTIEINESEKKLKNKILELKNTER